MNLKNLKILLLPGVLLLTGCTTGQLRFTHLDEALISTVCHSKKSARQLGIELSSIKFEATVTNAFAGEGTFTLPILLEDGLGVELTNTRTISNMAIITISKSELAKVTQAKCDELARERKTKTGKEKVYDFKTQKITEVDKKK